LRDALVAAVHFDIFNRHCDRVHMGNIAQTINVLQAVILTEPDSDRIVLTPTYHVFEMYKVHQDATLLPFDLQCEDYQFGDESVPSISASASRNQAGQVHLTVSNLTVDREIDLSCTLRGVEASGVDGRILTADRMNAINTFDAPEVVSPVAFAGASLGEDGKLSMKLPAKSVVVLELS
jgi:alpha-N-arabinofuranosidase